MTYGRASIVSINGRTPRRADYEMTSGVEGDRMVAWVRHVGQPTVDAKPFVTVELAATCITPGG